MLESVIPPAMPRTAYVLGAGFSKAISSRMPITDELGRMAIEELGLDGSTVPRFSTDGLTFENWLTWLAERQPYLAEAEHLRDQARFSELTTAIAAVLRRSQESAREYGYPSWLGEFVDLIHWSQSHVITLNYDTIVESELASGVRYDDDQHIRAADVVTGTPNDVGVFMAKAVTFRSRRTFHLHKLHGSIDWYAVPGDRTGVTLERVEPAQDARYAADATIGGREVFIVPPTSTKRTYFDHPKTRFVWQQARKGLAEAERVVLVGYSLPLTDTALARLLFDTLSKGDQEIVVVDPAPDTVVSRLHALGIDHRRIQSVPGIDCVSTFIESEVTRAGNEVIETLANLRVTSPTAPVAVGWDNRSWGAVTGTKLDAEDGTLTITLDAMAGSLGGIQHPSKGPDPATRPTRTIEQILGAQRPRRIHAVCNGQEWRVGALVRPSADVADDWILLRALGNAPR